ncbi:helix-turn-helix domain-containing protein [Cereibacter sphaeroides]|uniref:helix-turn-helix domain-containing protein n=1 Tax=Cereibacter sphaeroides TaxID=1063 RepID=UPI001F470DD8|nr:XRE family transcriptional regulator [Cereibacter sphaeroides]MCE6962230.1 helix-turn-helix domain-containing protein [Cereibacter sphaeroides]MCE6972400.1 helix-turn-helix domain-containing protein [Cereibacter sphaeroides]
MPMTALMGSRVRERRLQLGLRQAELARTTGISASYLNLIEHNRRRIGEDVLLRLARALKIDAQTLAAGAEGLLIEDLRAAAASAGDEQPELDRVEDLVGRFPGWARMLATQHRRIGLLERTVSALNDRMTHDTHLSEALHEVLSAVSAVRSTAAILAETEDIEPDWRARFHANIHADSERLAVGAEALVAYLDGSGEDDQEGLAAPQEEVEGWLAGRGWHLAELEAEGGRAVLEAEIEALVSASARAMARDWIARAAEDAAAMPLVPFRAALAAEGDPVLIARSFRVGVLAVFRRIATLPGAVAGLVICDGSGTLVFRKPPEGFLLPRFGAACPLWPLFEALARPMSPVEAVVEPAARTRRRFRARAYCEPRHPAGFRGPELREAGMLIEPAVPDPSHPPRAVGTSCRICPRPDCPARREPSILLEGS